MTSTEALNLTADGRLTIGIIGLGMLGMPVAENLLADGHRVVGYRRHAMNDLIAAGGDSAGSPREVAEMSELVLLCLPDLSALHDVVSGPNGLCEGLRPGSIVVELGTFPIADKLCAREALREVGVELIDAPVSGTPGMVRARRAVVMASGSPEAIWAAKPGLDGVGITRSVGEFGNGSKLKYVANTLVAIHTAAAAEVISLAESIGLDATLTIETVNAGAGSSKMFEIRAPWMAARDFVPSKGSVSVLRKDISVISKVAADANASMPMLAAARALYDRAAADGRSDHDIATLIEVMKGD